MFAPASKLKRVSPDAFKGCDKLQVVEYPPSAKLK